MATWKNININSNQIKAETGKSVLIALPHNSDYNGFELWHPKKLVRDGRHSASVSIGYTDEFVFKLKKYGKGRYNSNQVIDERTISAEELESAFGVTDENIGESLFKNPYETYKPATVEAVESVVPDELKDI